MCMLSLASEQLALQCDTKVKLGIPESGPFGESGRNEGKAVRSGRHLTVLLHTAYFSLLNPYA